MQWVFWFRSYFSICFLLIFVINNIMSATPSYNHTQERGRTQYLGHNYITVLQSCICHSCTLYFTHKADTCLIELIHVTLNIVSLGPMLHVCAQYFYSIQCTVYQRLTLYNCTFYPLLQKLSLLLIQLRILNGLIKMQHVIFAII